MNAAHQQQGKELMAQKQKPVHEFRLGRIRVAIWANQSNSEGVWFNTSIVRLYKDGDKWKETTAYGRDDLPLVSKAADMAYDWIWKQEVPAQPDESVDNG
jgi:hypothetical protein